MKPILIACGPLAAMFFVAPGAQAQLQIPTPLPAAPVPNRAVPLSDLLPRLRKPSDGMAPMPTRPWTPPVKPREYRWDTPKFLPPNPYNRPELFVTPSPDATPNTSASTSPDAAMAVDGDFLYILRGNTVIKMDKKTLKVVESTTLPKPTALPNTLIIPGLKKWSDSTGNHSGETHFGIGPAF